MTTSQAPPPAAESTIGYPRPERPVIFCLPPAGGSVATFRPWLRMADEGTVLEPLNVRLIQAELGRNGGQVTLVALAAAIADLLPPDRPFILAGHSLGGLLAYEAAFELFRRGARLPESVLVMGSRPPHDSSAEVFAPMIDLDDEDFLDAMEAVGAVNPELRNSPMRPLFLPALRRDLRVITTYRPDVADRRRAQLPVPLVGWCGIADSLAPPDVVRGWQDYTLFPGLEVFQGGHFFPFDDAGPCLQALESLARVSPVANTLHKS